MDLRQFWKRYKHIGYTLILLILSFFWIKNDNMGSLYLIVNAVKNKSAELITSMQVVMFLTFILSALMFFVERIAQPQHFKSVWGSFLWSVSKYIGGIAGYGNFSPVTRIGMMLGTFVGFLGIAIFAVPAGIIATGFIDEMNNMQYERHLEEVETKIERAFKIEYFGPVMRIKRKLKMEAINRKWLSIDDLKYRLLLSEKEVFDFARETDGYRLKSTRKKDGGRSVGLEKFCFNRLYGGFKNRNSRIVLVNTYGAIQSHFGHFTSSIAQIADLTYIANEKYAKASMLPDEAIDFTNGVNSQSIVSEPVLKQLVEDLGQVLTEESICILFVAAKKSQVGLHFNVGGAKGTGFEDSPLFGNNKILTKLYSNAENFCDKRDLGIYKQEHYGNLKETNIAWFIKKRFGCDVLLIHVNKEIFNESAAKGYYPNIADFAAIF